MISVPLTLLRGGHMTTNGGWVYVDDTDASIIYSGGDWTASKDDGPSGNEGVFDGTLHGATFQGITATLKFTGSEVGVIGTTGMTDVYGWPAVDFSIDGVQQYTNTFPPGISPTTLFTNVTFFDSPVTPGEHVLTITNLNGTAPNTFWFDYIFYMPLVDIAAPPTRSASASASPPGPTQAAGSSLATSRPTMAGPPSTTPGSSISGTPSGSLSTSLSSPVGTSMSSAAIANTSGLSDSPSTPGLPAPNQSGAGVTDPRSATATSHTGAIIGGAIGGVVLLALIAAFLVFRCIRRREENWDSVDDVTPDAMVERRFTALFPSAPPAPSVSSIGQKPEPTPADASVNPTPLSSEGTSVVASPGLAGAAVPLPMAEDVVPPPSRSKSRVRALAERLRHPITPPVVQEVDSGFRLPRDESVVGTLPPPYTPD